MHRKITLVVLILVLVAAPSAVQESATYSMERFAIATAASRVSSTHFDHTVVIGEDSPVGASSFCSGGFVSSMLDGS